MNTIGMVLLALILVVLAARLSQAMIGLIGDGTLLAIVVVALIGIAVGHLLGGPDEDNRTVLALTTASRHPAVALAVAGFAGQALAPAAVLLALVVTALAAVPYSAWRRRRRVDTAMPHEKAGFR